MLKSHYHCVSNNALSKKIGLSNTTVNKCYKGESLGIDSAIRFGDILGLNDTKVLIGNLCEKRLLTQRARSILLDLIGEKSHSKNCNLEALISEIEYNRSKQTNT